MTRDGRGELIIIIVIILIIIINIVEDGMTFRRRGCQLCSTIIVIIYIYYILHITYYRHFFIINAVADIWTISC